MTAAELPQLLERCTTFFPEGFSVDLSAEPEAWNTFFHAQGLRHACAQMAALLCARYRDKYGEEYLFSESCVSWELRYHAAAYMAASGYRGYARHISTLLLPRQKLILHCKEIDISTEDVKSLRQRLMFGYRRGVRTCYRGTGKDPFHRG